ncbi:hypothetical protein O1611_g1625 [Lasiodiplodia mahajangana]|uniref:Uncharacterized protein n=1 Tax=Lasiodiplodia mahajangana TaxID=1108764 RepID=A0ACC2JXH3_9PEZI|nr:hypothetical protein O1611_g1625 [Lasiodiplodia mahajangana]
MTASRRDSAATEMTLAQNTSRLAEKMESDEHFDDDEKTLSNLTLNDSSSSHSKTTLSRAMAKLKSKIKAKEEKPKEKAPIPPGYYPNTLQTFEALASTRI